MGWRGQRLTSLLVTKTTMAWAPVCLTLTQFRALDLTWPPSAYWNGKNTQRTQIPLVDSQIDESQFNSQPPLDRRTKSKSRPPPEFNDEELPAPVMKTRKLPSRAPSAAPSKKAPTTKNNTSAKTAALFIQSDDDDDKPHEFTPPPSKVVDHTSDAEETLQSNVGVKPAPGRRSTRTAKTSAKAKKTLVVEDESDDDAVFRGFRGKNGGR